MISANLGRFALLAPLALLQLLILWRARATARQDPKKALSRQGELFATDLKQRAGRGEGPDWLRYRAEAEREFEGRDERLRMLAAAALATGLASTLIALLAGLWWEAGHTEHLDALAVLRSAAICLLGSLIGVAVNLIIVLSFIPSSERRFAAQADALSQFLTTVAEQNPPIGALTGPLRDELAAIRSSLASGLAHAFTEAVTGWPQVVERLGLRVDVLGNLVDKQAQGVEAAMKDLAESSTAIAESSAALAPSAQRLGELGGLLVDLPTQLNEVLDRSRENWLVDLKQQQEQAFEHLVKLRNDTEDASKTRERQMLMAVRELQAAVADQRSAVDRIPGLLADEVRRVAKDLGREFGSEARAHTSDLEGRLELEHQRLWQRIELHEREVRNNIAAVVEDLFKSLRQSVDDGISSPFRAAAEDLKGVVATLPAAAERIEDAQRGWSATQAQELSGWHQASERLADLAGQLAGIGGGLDQGATAIAKSTAYIERIAGAQEGFEAALRSTLTNAVTRHLETYEPYHEQLMQMTRDLQAANGDLNQVLKRQADLIRQCIEQLVNRHRVPALEEVP